MAYRGTTLPLASHKSNPLSVPQGYVEICTLGHMGDASRCGSETLYRVTMTHWLTGLLSAQAKEEGIVMKAAWHRGSNSSVINNPLGAPGCTQCM
jgi:hypothetical protein